MSKRIDITKDIDYDSYGPDGECLPLTKCKCGQIFEAWTFNISMGEDSTTECPSCGRKLFFLNSLRVYEVQDE
jgi:hypothetical protein